MPLTDPNMRRMFRKELDRLWLLGRSLVVGWSMIGGRVALLLLPNARLPEIEGFGSELIGGGPRRLPPEAFQAAVRRFGLEPVLMERPEIGAPSPRAVAAIEALLRPYGLAFTVRRAVALVDIVAFSRATRLEQAAKLNSLAYSIAIAQRRSSQLDLDIDLGRSSTGDGFYLWNRRGGDAADVDLACLVLLALADNRLAADGGGVVPLLRAGLTTGSHFSFFQPDSDGDRNYEFIVGETTIALARIVAAATPKQIVLGVGDSDGVQFASAVQQRLVGLGRIALPDVYLRCVAVRLSGGAAPRRSIVQGKHGIDYPAYNLRADLELDDGAAVSLGLATEAEPPRAGFPAPASAGTSRQSATVSPPST